MLRAISESPLVGVAYGNECIPKHGGNHGALSWVDGDVLKDGTNPHLYWCRQVSQKELIQGHPIVLDRVIDFE